MVLYLHFTEHGAKSLEFGSDMTFSMHDLTLVASNLTMERSDQIPRKDVRSLMSVAKLALYQDAFQFCSVDRIAFYTEDKHSVSFLFTTVS